MIAIDGIDEVPVTQRDGVVEQILQLAIDYPSAAMLVTTRQSGVIPWKDRLIREGNFSPWRLQQSFPRTDRRVRFAVA